MNRWIDSLRGLKKTGEPAMLATVMDIRGSAPRECGAKMLVTASELIGTIGGGQLEYQCTRIACERMALARSRRPRADTGREFEATSLGEGSCGDSFLAEGESTAFVQRFPLGSNCGQCCGGVVEVLFEDVTAAAWVPELLALYDERAPFVIATAIAADGNARKLLVTAEGCHAYRAASEGWHVAVADLARQLLAEHASGARRLRLKYPEDVSLLLEPVMSSSFNLALFGAGHVGSAVVATMARLDCNIRWIDSRRDIFPDKVPSNVACLESESPQREVAAMPANAYYLVMTHSHPLDFEICSRILARGDFAYCGLIGSVSKRRRFEKQMRKQGVPAAALDRLTCPIGIPGIDSKKPEAIAIAVAAELLQTHATSKAMHERAPPNLIRAL